MIQIDAVHDGNRRRDLPPFRPGDRVRVHVNITEGDKQRIQVFEGIVIRRRGAGRSETFTVRKLSYGVGVERIFLVESPAVTKVEIKSRGHVRRSRLYYLRGRTGKKARLRSKVRDLSRLVAPDADEAGTADAAAQAAEEEAVARVPEDAPEADAPPAAEPPENAGQPG
jgi:large subunit ribosomal protein L19